MALVDTLRLVGVSGTNKVMAGELSRLTRRATSDVRLPQPAKVAKGDITFPFDARVASIAVHYHRTCSRVLWDLCQSRAKRLEQLFDDVLEDLAGDSRSLLWDGARISVRARNVGAFAAGERQVVGTVKNALVEIASRRGMALRVDPEAPDLLFCVRMHDDVLTVSLDLAGGPMHRRGYRVKGGMAPLRENVAAVLTMLARYDARSEVLVDPMAGSGTIAIEAALMGRAAPLWGADAERLPRLPAFAELELPSGALFADTAPMVVANEIHTPTVAIARENVELAGVNDHVSILHGDFRDLTSDRIERALGGRCATMERGVIVCNPPYGERLRSGDELDLYRDLSGWCRLFPGWRAAILCAHEDFEHAFGLRPRIKKPLRNGPQPAYFYLYDL